MAGTDKWFAIINPSAGDGKGLKDWPHISKLLRDQGIIPEYAFTERKYHAIELVVDAVTQGYRKLMVVGCDGTVHEAINGLFIQKSVPAAEVLLAVIPVGIRRDWIRMPGLPLKYPDAVNAIAGGHSSLQDVGLVSYHNATYRQDRYMANMAGTGLDAFTVRRITKLKEDGRRGSVAYFIKMLRSIFKYRSTGVKVWIDGELVVNNLIYNLTVVIGRQGRGPLSPEATACSPPDEVLLPDDTPPTGHTSPHEVAHDISNPTPPVIAGDGFFDVTITRHITKAGILRRLRALYHGRFDDLKQTSHFRGREIRIESSPEIPLEADGMMLGFSPFDFRLIDRALCISVPAPQIPDTPTPMN